MTGVYAGILVVLGLALIVGLAAIGLTAYRQRGVDEPEHEGVTLDTPPLPPAQPITAEQVDEVEDTGRHHIGHVSKVSPEWMPPTGRHRIAAQIDDTQRIEIDPEDGPE